MAYGGPLLTVNMCITQHPEPEALVFEVGAGWLHRHATIEEEIDIEFARAATLERARDACYRVADELVESVLDAAWEAATVPGVMLSH